MNRRSLLHLIPVIGLFTIAPSLVLANKTSSALDRVNKRRVLNTIKKDLVDVVFNNQFRKHIDIENKVDNLLKHYQDKRLIYGYYIEFRTIKKFIETDVDMYVYIKTTPSIHTIHEFKVSWVS